MTEILVVDDDRDVAQSIEMALRRHEFRVTLAHSGVEALKSLDLAVARHSIFGFLGPNGAGKSTLLGLLAGTIDPTTGHISRGSTVNLRVLDQRLASLDDGGVEGLGDLLCERPLILAEGGAQAFELQLGEPEVLGQAVVVGV